MRTSTLVEDMPQFEIRDGLLHITGNTANYALPLAVVRQCMPAIADVIAKFDSRASNVIPLYAGCHGCPGHPHAA